MWEIAPHEPARVICIIFPATHCHLPQAPPCSDNHDSCTNERAMQNDPKNINYIKCQNYHPMIAKKSYKCRGIHLPSPHLPTYNPLFLSSPISFLPLHPLLLAFYKHLSSHEKLRKSRVRKTQRLGKKRRSTPAKAQQRRESS